MSAEDRAKFAVWMGHSSQGVRALAHRIVPRDALWEAATAMLAGTDYSHFVYANRWLSDQEIDERYRAQVLEALSPMLLIRDEGTMRSLDNFCKCQHFTASM